MSLKGAETVFQAKNSDEYHRFHNFSKGAYEGLLNPPRIH